MDVFVGTVCTRHLWRNGSCQTRGQTQQDDYNEPSRRSSLSSFAALAGEGVRLPESPDVLGPRCT